jgi:ubiquinone/menaquinone biosynthesis C-methylase UbiE
VNPAFDCVALEYDATRGGESRGAQYAEVLDPYLLPGKTLEVGVGTGVVALALGHLRRQVVGIDISQAMLGRAQDRVAGTLVAGDAATLPFPDGCFENVYAVWVLHAVADPLAVLLEMGRVLRPGGRCLVCPTNRPAPGDVLGLELDEMFHRVEAARPKSVSWTGFSVTAERIVGWAVESGLSGVIEPLAEQSWETTPSREREAIRNKVWSAMKELDEDTYQAVTAKTLRFLDGLSGGAIRRRAIAEVVIMEKAVTE